MKALVTGGAGFIGSALVDRLLAEGHAVDVVDDLSSGTLAHLAAARSSPHGRFSFVRADIRSPELADLFARSRPHVVFHLAALTDAAVSTARPAFDAEVNVAGSVAVIDAARACGAAKVVFASDQRIYGHPKPAQLPVKESATLLQPVVAAGVAKKVVVDYLRTYREEHNLEFTALVLADVYGPRQDPERADAVVARLAAQLATGRSGEISGDGARTRDLVYVDDAVDALARAWDRGGGLVLNVGTGHETSADALYALVAAAVGNEEPPTYGPAGFSLPRRMALDPARAGMHLGWKPWTSVAEGVAAVVDGRRRAAAR